MTNNKIRNQSFFPEAVAHYPVFTNVPILRKDCSLIFLLNKIIGGKDLSQCWLGDRWRRVVFHLMNTQALWCPGRSVRL